MFINCTNHPSKNWSKEQYDEALRIGGEIKDIRFPSVSAEASEKDVQRLAAKLVERIVSENPDAVLCQGEFTLVYLVVDALIKSGIKVYAACSNRQTEEIVNPDGTVKKIARFRFARFRRYGTCDG